MKLRWYLNLPICLTCLLVLLSQTHLTATQPPRASISDAATNDAAAGSWYFTVSGDSRDCGDLIMPKIARAIADHPTQPAVAFYWHLGDFRALYRVDCDIAKRTNPHFKCLSKKVSPDETPAQKKQYLKTAWQDFIDFQLGPFKEHDLPVFLGIGNHELIDRTRGDYREQFAPWLKQDWIQAQRKADEANNISSMDGDTYYHFIRNGVDFIYLDNAKDNAFFADEVNWLFKVLDADARDDSVKTIIVGMHEALPGSKASNHAMDDAACTNVCQAQQVYDRLSQAQNLNGPAAKRKHVYLLASHSHINLEDLYDTPAHKGQVIKGWLIGTAGAEQYRTKIGYGYLQVEVRPDGTINAEFKKIGKNDPPIAPRNSSLIKYCFEKNNVKPPEPKQNPCQCSIN